MPLLEGKVLDHYELRRLVGKGGMANVYEALDLQNQHKVAVKVFKREDEGLLRRFMREAHVMASLRHEHLVPIIDSGQCQVYGDVQYYIVMPFFDGGTLRARIRRSALSLQEACKNLQGIPGALDYIHSQGIIHRDIKASNILLNSDEEVFLTDFGIARIATDATQLTSTGDVLGTVDYVAPELFEGHRRADSRSDLYSLGILLYEMVTGRLPFTADSQLVVVSMHINMSPPSPRDIVPTISSQIERVLYKALEKKPAQRYTSATELAEAFCYAVTSNEKDKAQSSVQKSLVEQNEVHIPPEVTSGSEISPATSVATINTVPGQSPHVNSVVGHQFKSPQTVFKSAPLRPELPINPLTPSPIPEEGRQPERKRWFTVLLAFLALIILVASVISVLLFRPLIRSGHFVSNTASQNSTGTSAAIQTTTIAATPNLTATAMAAQAATATAKAQETAIAIAGMTVTTEAKASATAGVILTATSGLPVYLDTLNNANNASTVQANWDQNSKCIFGTDGYHVKEGTNWHGCKESANTYQNMALTVNMRILSGITGGLFFRVNTDIFGEYSGYLFEITTAGKYRISLFSQRINATITPLRNWTFSSALRQGYTASNTLQVIAQGNSLSLYAN
ncbi:MAG TPA: serine/threonine-protein kinase, partial [Ktedonobacteraceae bacterium]|nr:serine/threonine-protein kinase [Ktedonobacteraceae bacterium]